MTRSPRRWPRPSRAHLVALLTALSFGCTTVRAPASSIAPVVPIDRGAAEPQVELWLESARDVSPAEAARASADAKASLQRALAGRDLGEDVLVVRAQAVSRTQSHRSDQRAAKVGIVVGAVALVAVVVVAVVASQGKGGAPSVRGGGGHARVHPPAAGPGPVASAPARIAPSHAPRLGAGAGAVGPSVRVGAAVELPVPVEVGPWDGPVAMQAGPGTAGPVEAPAPPLSPDAPEPPAPRPGELVGVALPPPPPLDLSRRGFFDKDLLRLELVVVDRSTGIARAAKQVEEDVDVRDAAAVRRMIDRALADPGGWGPPPVDRHGA